MRRDLWIRVGLVYLAGANALVGFWAAFAPRSFYLDFPGGSRAWISADGPYNEHLVRDVGELNLALFVVVAAAAISLSRPLVRAALAATIVNGVVHVLYHARHLGPYGSGDQIGIIGSLVFVPVVAVVLLIVVQADPERIPTAAQD